MAGISFSNTGATPNMGFAKTLNGLLTPKKTAAAPSPTYPTPTGKPIASSPTPVTGVQGTTVGNKYYPNLGNADSAIGHTVGLIGHKPTTPLKKTTINNVDGSSTIHEYHAPPTNNTSQNAPKTQDSAPPAPTVFQRTVGNLADTQNSSYNNTAQQAIEGLLGASAGNQVYADRAQQIANQAGNQISSIGRQGASAQAGYLSTGTSPVAEGNAAINAQSTAAQEQAVTQGANMQLVGNAQGLTAQGQEQSGFNAGAGQALAGQGTQQSALSSAGQLSSPTSQFGLLTDPLSGQIIGGNGSNAQQLMGTSLQKAVQLYNSGAADFNTALSVSGLAQFGNLGNSLLSSALTNGGGFNPTTQATQIATNQSNLGGFQTQATNLDTSLKQVETIAPNILNLLKTSGLNPTDSELTNTPINNYISQLGDTLAGKQLSLVMNDLQKFSAQILSADNSLTPTQKTQSVLNQDPSTLSFKQMQGYLDSLKALGGNQLSVVQGQIKNLGGTGIGYSGTPTTPTTNLPSTTPNRNMQGLTFNTAGQALGGAGLEIGKDIGSAVTNGGNILSFILGKVFPK